MVVERTTMKDALAIGRPNFVSKGGRRSSGMLFGDSPSPAAILSPYFSADAAQLLGYLKTLQ